jgi:hypothetical protein
LPTPVIIASFANNEFEVAGATMPEVKGEGGAAGEVEGVHLTDAAQ